MNAAGQLRRLVFRVPEIHAIARNLGSCLAARIPPDLTGGVALNFLPLDLGGVQFANRQVSEPPDALMVDGDDASSFRPEAAVELHEIPEVDCK